MEEKRKVYQKWWFWVCIVLLALIVGFVIIMAIAFSTVTSGISGVAMQIQNISDNATLYSSAGDNILILQIDHFDKLKDGDLKEMINTIKDNSSTTFESYSKFIILNYIDVENQENPMLLVKEYSMPDLKETKELTYVDFNLYEEAVEGYGDLFNQKY